MDQSNLEAQTCVACGKEFLPEVVEAIPMCSACTAEEEGGRERTVTVTQSRPKKNAVARSVSEETYSSDLDVPESELTQTQAHTVGLWHVRKADGRTFGPFPTEQLHQWIDQGKVLSGEEISSIAPEEGALWERIGKHPTFRQYIEGRQSQFRKESPFAETAFEDSSMDIPSMDEFSEEVDLPLDEAGGGKRFGIFPFRLRRKSVEEAFDSEPLFAGTQRKRKREFERKTWIAISVAAGVLLFSAVAVWTAPRWTVALKKTFGKTRPPDRVDDYIAEFQQKLGAVSGKPDEFYREGLKQFSMETEGSYREAERLFESALILHHEHPGAMSGLAEVLTEKAFLTEDTALFSRAYDLALKGLELAPDKVHSHRAVARLFIRLNNRLPEAKTHLDRVLQGDPNDAEGLSLSSSWILAQGKRANLPEARSLMERALGISPDRGSFYFFKGEVASRAFDYRGASLAYSKVPVSGASGDGQSIYFRHALAKRAEIHLACGDIKGARAFFEAALSQPANSKNSIDTTATIDTKLELADLLIDRFDDVAGAEGILDSMFVGGQATGTPAQQKLLFNLKALARKEKGDLGGAREFFQKGLVLDPYHRLLRFNLGVTLLEAGNEAEAYKIFDGLRGWDDGPFLFPYFQGLAFQFQTERWRDAMQIHQPRATDFGGAPQDRIALFQLLLLLQNPQGAQQALWKGAMSDLGYLRDHDVRAPFTTTGKLRLAKVLETQKSFVREDPESAMRLTGYAYLLAISGNPAEALKVVERAAVQDPQDLPTLHLYGALLIQQGQYERAGEILRSALRYEVKNLPILTTLAESYLRAGKYNLARLHLQTAIDTGQAPSKAYYLRGQMSEALRENKLAKADYIEALNLDPTYLLPKQALFAMAE